MSVTALTNFAPYAGKIANSGHDEHNRYSGGKAGDQSGTEWYIRSWYNRPWDVVIRFTDKKIADMIATLSIYAAQNNRIGYDQGQRTTYWTALKKAGYDPRKITTACEDDCSAGVMANIRAALELTGHSSWAKNININATTWTMKGNIFSCGAKVKTFTDASHTKGTAYLLPGDILLKTSAHTAVNLGRGSRMPAENKVDNNTDSKIPGTCTVRLKEFLVGAKDPQVKTIQILLNAKGYVGKNGKPLTVDGSLGENTAYAIEKLQRAKGMKDINFGTVAATTWKYLLDA